MHALITKEKFLTKLSNRGTTEVQSTDQTTVVMDNNIHQTKEKQIITLHESCKKEKDNNIYQQLCKFPHELCLEICQIVSVFFLEAKEVEKERKDLEEIKR